MTSRICSELGPPEYSAHPSFLSEFRRPHCPRSHRLQPAVPAWGSFHRSMQPRPAQLLWMPCSHPVSSQTQGSPVRNLHYHYQPSRHRSEDHPVSLQTQGSPVRNLHYHYQPSRHRSEDHPVSLQTQGSPVRNLHWYRSRPVF